MIELSSTLDYPIIAIADLHGQYHELSRLVETLESRPEWPDCALVFLGDFVDRNNGVKETIGLVLELLRRPRGGSAVMGNHDLALVPPGSTTGPLRRTGSRATGPAMITRRRSSPTSGGGRHPRATPGRATRKP